MREQLLTAACRYGVEVIAYCFMPDHLHALLTGRSESGDAGKAMAVFRRQSGFHYKRRCSRRLWQDGYFDRVLRKEEQTAVVVRYLLANPVRAGLVDDPGTYEHSGASDYTLAELLRFVEDASLG